MAGTYLDTTIVIRLSQAEDDVALESHLATAHPREYPSYSLREMLVGYLRTFCDLHNRILASSNIGEVLLAIAAINPLQTRRKQSSLQEFGNALYRRCENDADVPQSVLLKEVRRDLGLQVARMWRKARNLKGQNVVQPLACFSPGPIARGEVGEFRGVGGTFNCRVNERCAAAAYLFDDQAVLSKMIESLLPENVSDKISGKRETISRRKALKELVRVGPDKFNKGMCRAIGDAYFAAMCPWGSTLVTSNGEDFEVLCSTLGKTVDIV